MKVTRTIGVLVLSLLIGLSAFYLSGKITNDDVPAEISEPSYHADEKAWLGTGLATFKEFFVSRDYSKATWLNKKFGIYGTLSPNMGKFVYGAVLYSHGVRRFPDYDDRTEQFTPWTPVPPSRALVVGRTFARIMTAAGCVLLCLLAWRLSGSCLAGLLSGIMFAASPMVIECSNRVWLDTPAVLFTLVAMLIATWCIGSRRAFAWIVLGLAIGVAVSTKMNALLLVPAIGMARLFKDENWWHVDCAKLAVWLKANTDSIFQTICFGVLVFGVFAQLCCKTPWVVLVFVFSIAACLWHFREKRSIAVTFVLMLTAYAVVMSKHKGVDSLGWPWLLVSAGGMLVSSLRLLQSTKLLAGVVLAVSLGVAMSAQCGLLGLAILVIAWQFPKLPFSLYGARREALSAWIAVRQRLTLRSCVLAAACFLAGLAMFIATNPFLWTDTAAGMYTMLARPDLHHFFDCYNFREAGWTTESIVDKCFMQGVFSWWTGITGWLDFSLFCCGVWKALSGKRKSLLFVSWSAVYFLGIAAWLPDSQIRWYLPLAPIVAIGEALGLVAVLEALAAAGLAVYKRYRLGASTGCAGRN